MKRTTALLILLLAGSAAARQSAQPPQTFKSGVQTVEVDVRVFDKAGRFVTDLKAEDFEVVEDGVPQNVQTSFLVAAPGPGAVAVATPPATAAPAAATPAATLPPPASARQTWIFVFDLNHLTPGGGFERARKAVEDFLRDRWKEGDLAGVVAGSKMVNNRLTSVKQELVDAVKGIKPLVETRNRLISLTREWPKILNEDEAIRIVRGEKDALQRAVIRACTEDADACKQVPPDVQIMEKCRNFVRENQRSSLQTLQALNALASGLARVPGPKTIVLLTDGFVTEELETTLRSVVGQTARAGGRVYSLDVRGLNRGARSGLEQVTATDEAGAPAQFDVLEDGPNSLAVDTGGLMIRNENNLGRALDRIAADSGQYYVLGYSPTNATFDGKYRQIQVRVKRPDVRVRARRGYLAIEPAKMLVPRAITSEGPSVRGSESPKGREAESSKVRGTETPEPPPVTATGTVVATPPAAAPASGTVRLRPDAEKQVETLAKGATTSAGDLAKKGWEAYQRGDVENALTAFTEAAARPDVRPWVLYALGLSNAALGRPADAAAVWERVRQAAPDFEAVYIDLADAYLQAAEASKALAVLRDADKRWPADPEILNAIGVIHVRRGALDEAISIFGKATEAAPGDPLGYFNLAKTYELRFVRGQRYVSSQREWVSSDGDRDKAEEHYKKCIALGGPYAQEAKEAISRLLWSKK